jgi:hypothetical protein
MFRAGNGAVGNDPLGWSNGLTTEVHGASLAKRRSRWNRSARMAAQTKTMRCVPGCWSAAAVATVL